MINKEDALKNYAILLRDNNKGTISKVAFPEDVQVGLSTAPTELALTGRLRLNTTTYKCVPGRSVTLSDNCGTALVEPTSTSIAGTLGIVLPRSPKEGHWINVKDSFGSASTHNVVVSTGDATTIDGASTKTLSVSYGSMSFVWKDNNWNTMTETAVGDITSVTAGNGLTGGGTSGGVTLAINNGIVATVSGTTFTGITNHTTGLSGSLTKLTDGTSYLIAGDGMTITSGSTGNVTIASSGVWSTYTPALTATASPPTKPTGYTLSAMYYVHNKLMLVNILFGFANGATGANGAGSYLFDLPVGYEIDTSITGTGTIGANYMDGKPLGFALINYDTTAGGGSWSAIANSSTKVVFVGQMQGSSANPVAWGATIIGLTTHTDFRFTCTMQIPLL